LDSSPLQAKRKRAKTCQHPELEAAMLKWFKCARANNVPISGTILKEKAKDLSTQLGITDFKASEGWLNGFKTRHGISGKVISGEAASVNDSEVDAWKGHKLPDILKRFQPKDIYNADETGLFFQSLPNRSLVQKGESCSGGKESKNRLTVLVCANMSGCDKVPLFVIGRSLKPRCFKGVKSLPCQYTANKKAWMTGDLFTEWLRKLDASMRRQKRKIALILDNAPCHPSPPHLTNIELCFLPPNTTSKTQPMDQGVIRCLKAHYRRNIVRRLLKAMEQKQDTRISVLDALQLISKSWAAVTPAAIAHCFNHCGFISEDDNEDHFDDAPDDDDDIPLAQLLRDIEREGAAITVSAEEFINCDEGVATCAGLTDTDIIDEVTGTNQSEELEDIEEDGDQVTAKPPSATEVLAMCDSLRVFVQTQPGGEDLFNAIASIEGFTQKCQTKKRVQCSIERFFKK
jgi:hypothetical protein